MGKVNGVISVFEKGVKRLLILGEVDVDGDLVLVIGLGATNHTD